MRYFNPSVSKVCRLFLGLINLFEDNLKSLASAEIIFSRIKLLFEQNNIPIENCIGFGSDGCNTMMTANNSVMTRFKEICPDIYISKCLCHSIHNCASNAAKQLPRRCEDLVKDICNFFIQSAKRKSIFLKFQDLAKTPIHQMLHPAQTRWLTFHPAVKRVLEVWDALLPFFASYNISEKCESSDRIVQNLNDVQIKLYFLF